MLGKIIIKVFKSKVNVSVFILIFSLHSWCPWVLSQTLGKCALQLHAMADKCVFVSG